MVFFVFPKTSFAATVTVTSRNDTGVGTLRNALAAVADGDTIEFNLSSGNETIIVSSTLYLPFNKSVIIDGDNTAGSGTQVTVQVSSPSISAYPVITSTGTGATKTATLKNLILRGGTAGTGSGGTIYFWSSGTLVIDSCLVKDGRGRFGAGLWANGFNGLTITNSTFQDNYTSESGGAARIDTFASTVSITNSTFTNNRSTVPMGTNSFGAALYIYNNSAQGSLSIDKTTFNGNYFSDGSSFGSGGALYVNNVATISITNSTLNNNTSSFSYGAGLLRGTTVTLTNNTVAANTADYTGGLSISATTSYLTNNTITANTATGDNNDGIYMGSGTMYAKNNIIANNGTGGADKDFTNSGGTITSNGYNIVEYYSGVTWGGTGDIVGNQVALNLETTLADNSGVNGVKTLALLTGSVAINAGNSTPNNVITVSSVDQRGLYRAGAVDIGAYEYEGTLSPSSFSLTYAAGANGSLSGDLTQTVSLGEDGTAVTAIPAEHYHFVDWSDGSTANPRTDTNVQSNQSITANFAIDTYSVAYSAGAHGSITGTASQTVNWGGSSTEVTAVADNLYHFTNWSDGSTANPRTDANIQAAISVSAQFAPDDSELPEISSLTASPESNTVVIRWQTDEVSSTQVEYGLNTAYGFSTIEQDVATPVLQHEFTITDLKSCARYFYRAKSKDETGNQSISERQSFVTSGCETSSINSGTESVLPTSGGSLEIINNLSRVLLSIPDNFASQQATFQLNKLETSGVLSNLQDRAIANDNLYSLIAVTDGNDQLTSFINPVTFTVRYGTDTENDFVEDTLDVYKFENGEWIKKNCTLSVAENSLSCTLSGFSVYGVLGQQKVQTHSTTSSPESSPSVNNSSELSVCSDEKPIAPPDLFQIDTTNSTATLYFGPISNAKDYYISFSEEPIAVKHGTGIISLSSEGVQQFTISFLEPNEKYFFKVRGQNGCATGEWSSSMEIKADGRSYFASGPPAQVRSSELTMVGKAGDVAGASTTETTTLEPIVLSEPEIVVPTPSPTPFVEPKKKTCFIGWCW